MKHNNLLQLIPVGNQRIISLKFTTVIYGDSCSNMKMLSQTGKVNEDKVKVKSKTK